MITVITHCQGCGNKVLRYMLYPQDLAVITQENFQRSCPHCKQVGLFWLRVVQGEVTAENDPYRPGPQLEIRPNSGSHQQS